MTFQRQVLDLCKKIPKGKVSTYKQIGDRLSKNKENKGMIYRAVGRALHQNKSPISIPCHRVICSDGSLGGYSGGLIKKKELLMKEGIRVKDGKINLKEYLYRF